MPDEVETDLSDYQTAAKKICSIYATAYPEAPAELLSEPEIDAFVKELFDIHPTSSGVRFWRIIVTALIAHLDDYQDGEIRPTETVYGDRDDLVSGQTPHVLVTTPESLEVLLFRKEAAANILTRLGNSKSIQVQASSFDQ